MSYELPVVRYIGCSRRNVVVRMGNHEASVRRFNDRTTAGQHMINFHPELRTSAADVKRGTVNFNNLFENFTPKILCKCRETLDTYIWEGIHIRERKPALNNMCSNGFI